MGLRCFLFSSDQAAAETIRQVLTGLDVEVDSCSEAVPAVDQISKQAYQIVIIDWDKPEEAGLLLATARERKASERPITLAIVGNDASVPKALQAGANSILRKPILTNQVKDTLQTARDLLRSKREPSSTISPSPKANAAAAAASASVPAMIPLQFERNKEKSLRAGEFLQSASASPGGSFVTESDLPSTPEQSVPQPVDPLRDLEPVAASMATQNAEPPVTPQPANEPRGLEWYIKARGGRQPFLAPKPKEDAGSQLLGFEMSSSAQLQATTAIQAALPAAPKWAAPSPLDELKEQKKEADLHSYIDEGNSGETEENPKPGFRLGIGTIIFALLLASGATLAAPQAPWHPKMKILWVKGQHSLHVWLNPQPVTPTQAPPAHESFGRAGDEYKLPAAENIPDATTDPSQIKVLPVIDPTAKKPTTDPGVEQSTAPIDSANPAPAEGMPAPEIQVNEQPQQVTVTPTRPAAASAVPSNPVTASPVAAPPHSEAPAPAATTPASSTPASSPVPVRNQQPRAAVMPGNIPSSLRSQLASSTPDASGSKSPEAAMQSIEPVVVAENVERLLLQEQPALTYPATAKGQQGTVILQVLIGRDGSVQDAKFMQGSLAFARNAIEGVRQWKFKSYFMNGRPVSVQTSLTLSFKPGQ